MLASTVVSPYDMFTIITGYNAMTTFQVTHRRYRHVKTKQI